MPRNLLKNFSKKESDELFDSLYYMNMKELKAFCKSKNFLIAGKKGVIIQQIQHYLMTGEALKSKVLPRISKAKLGKQYPLRPNTLILKGSYKNDEKTRHFFQSLVGKHFHFTAFGQDWISNRWHQGKPPTYAQFAKFWEKEFNRRKKSEAKPKKEWAYLNFMQRYQKDHPKATKKESVIAWKKIRKEKAEQAKAILDNLF